MKAGLLSGTYKLYLCTNHWKDIRAKKIEKNPICEFCKKNKATEVHHLRYLDEEGRPILYREKLKDLVSLCRNCHKRVHFI